MSRILKRVNNRLSLGGAATLIVSVTLLAQALGFLRNRLISTNFTIVDPGASDAFFAAFIIPDFFYYTIAAGALGVAFMPFLADRLEQGDRKSVWELVNSLLNVLTVVMLFVAIIILIFARPMIHALAPNLPQENLNQAVLIMRFLALNPLFFTISGILTSVQQTFGRFFFYAIAPLLYNLAIIVSIFIFRENIGVVGLGIGAAFGGILQLALSTLGLYGLGFKYKPYVARKNKDFRSILRNLPPRSLDQGIDQVNSIVETNRAQALGVGPISWYNFAATIHNVPIMLLGNSVAIAAFPRLIERLSQNRPDLFRKEFLQVLRVMLWLTMPVIVVAYFCRGYLARLIFGDVAPEVSSIFGYLVLAILFRIIYSMFSRYFYAHKDTKTPLFVSIFAIALNIYLAFTLSRPSSYGVEGLAIAQSIVAMSEVAILFAVIFKREPHFFTKDFWQGMIKIIAVTGFTLITAFILLSVLPLAITDKGFFVLGTKLGFITLITFGTHLLLSQLLDLEEARPVIAKIKQFVLGGFSVFSKRVIK